MTAGKVDHRRATAERNAAAILDACERLLAGVEPLTMVALAAEAGVSRPTLYAHYRTVSDVVEAAVKRSVDESLAAIAEADPESGPPADAVARMAAASWSQLARFEGLTRRAAEYVTAGAAHRTHAPLMAQMEQLVERGRRDGSFRTDLPTAWLVTMFYATVHAAHDHATMHRIERDDALALVQTTLRDLLAARS